MKCGIDKIIIKYLMISNLYIADVFGVRDKTIARGPATSVPNPNGTTDAGYKGADLDVFNFRRLMMDCKVVASTDCPAGYDRLHHSSHIW